MIIKRIEELKNGRKWQLMGVRELSVSERCASMAATHNQS